MRVCVLMGGVSRERDISLRSGRAVSLALSRKGHEVMSLDVKPQELGVQLKGGHFDAAFIALHGHFGEDGCVQGILEGVGVPYTGSSVKASALCFDKLLSKRVVEQAGIATPAYQVFRRGDEFQSWVEAFRGPMPCVVKPNEEGSTIGVTKVMNREGLAVALQQAIERDQMALVEALIEGREVTVSVLDGEAEPQEALPPEALPIVEVRPHKGFYDFEAKYTKGQTEYLVPAPLSAQKTKQIQDMAVQVFELLGCSGAARVDFMLNKRLKPYFLEINTIPGMTETSLLPKAAQVAGIGFDELCERILKRASLKRNLS